VKRLRRRVLQIRNSATPDTLGTVVEVEVIWPQEADECDVELACYLDGEARWCSDGGHHGDTGHERFLQQFEAGTAGKQQNTLTQG